MGGFDGSMLFLLGALALLGLIMGAIGLYLVVVRWLSEKAYIRTIVNLEFAGVFTEQTRGFTPPDDLLRSWRRLQGIRYLWMSLALLLGLGCYWLIATRVGGALWQTAPSGMGLLLLVLWSLFSMGMLFSGPIGLMLTPHRQPPAEDTRLSAEASRFRRFSLFILVVVLVIDAAVALWATLMGHTTLVTDAGGTITYPFWIGPLLMATMFPLDWLARRWLARVALRQFTHDAAWAASADRDIRQWLWRQAHIATAMAIANIGIGQALMCIGMRDSWPYPLALYFVQFSAFLVAPFEMGGRARPARPEAALSVPDA